MITHIYRSFSPQSQGNIVMQEKKDLRKTMLDRRNAMDAAEKKGHDERICTYLEQLAEERNVRAIHTYLPMGSEVDIRPFIEKMLARGITVATPKALKGRKMENLVLRSLTDLEDGIYGTKHPANSVEYTGNYGLFVIPGLAFDNHRYRLGYGSGYYDTFFSMHPTGYKLGICYPFQIVTHVPVEAHDVQLDEVYY